MLARAPKDNGKGEEAAPLWLCGGLEVLASARDEDGGDWSIVVEFRDPEPSKTHNDQCLAATVPTVPAVLATFDKRHGIAPAEAAKIDPGEWEERAAILEYEAGLDRATAERLAAVLVRRT